LYYSTIFNIIISIFLTGIKFLYLKKNTFGINKRKFYNCLYLKLNSNQNKNKCLFRLSIKLSL